jgi:hypothetical protein
MHSDRDMPRIVRSWLRTDEHESADRVLDNVLALLDTTPQRRSRWPARRITDMNTYAKLAIAAAAVVVAVVVGINLLPAQGRVGSGPAASPSTSPAPSPTLSPSPSASSASAFPPAGSLAIGTQAMTRGGIPLSLELPTTGWRSEQGYFLNKGTGVAPEAASILFWNPDPEGVYADPCAHVVSPPAGPSTAELANAVARIPGVDIVSGPSDVTVGGHAAKRVVLTVPETVGCKAGDGGFYLWYDLGQGSGCAGTQPCPRYASALGSTYSVWIIDVDGKRLFIEAESYKGASPQIRQELQRIVDSITFG